MALQGVIMMAKTKSQQLKEMNDFIDTFSEGLRQKSNVKSPTKVRKLNKSIDTIADLRNEFILHRQGKGSSPETIRTYENHLNRLQDFIGFMSADDTVRAKLKGEFYDYVEQYQAHIRNLGGKAPIRILETPNFMAYFADFLTNTKGLKEQTVISSMRHIRAFIYFAQENKWINDFDIKIKDKALPIKDIYSKTTLEKLIKKPKNDGDFVAMRNWLMIKYLLLIPNRISTMLELKVGDVDFENNVVRVNYQKANNPKNYRFNTKIRQDLRKFIEDFHTDDEGNINYDEYLFSNQFGGKLNYSSCRQAMERYFDARNIDFGGFHKFRYTYSANWIMDGGDPFTLKEQLGHTSLAMTNHYAETWGSSHNDEIDEHSLINKVKSNAGRKKKKKRVRD